MLNYLSIFTYLSCTWSTRNPRR